MPVLAAPGTWTGGFRSLRLGEKYATVAVLGSPAQLNPRMVESTLTAS
jgi:hypothetical protein